jgi:hypothetical protein
MVPRAAALLLALLALATVEGRALAAEPKPPPAAKAAPETTCPELDQTHAAWTAIVSRHVKDGVVDYAGLRRGGRWALDDYLKSLERICKTTEDGWSSAQRLAFWINTYNAYMVRLVLDHSPADPSAKIEPPPRAAFRDRFIGLERLRGRTLSLDDVENQILRREFKEPRIHFALVCGSMSCPSLRTEAYRAPDLDRQLDEAARGFVRDSSKNRLDAAARTFFLSSIFAWYREDFERAAGSLPSFVARYADPQSARALSSGELKLSFLDYDWSLNGR